MNGRPAGMGAHRENQRTRETQSPIKMSVATNTFILYKSSEAEIDALPIEQLRKELKSARLMYRIIDSAYWDDLTDKGREWVNDNWKSSTIHMADYLIDSVGETVGRTGLDPDNDDFSHFKNDPDSDSSSDESDDSKSANSSTYGEGCRRICRKCGEETSSWNYDDDHEVICEDCAESGSESECGNTGTPEPSFSAEELARK